MHKNVSSMVAGVIMASIVAGMPSVAAAQESCASFSWTTLGTAGGPAPTPERAEPSHVLRAGELLVLVDTGDGIANQLARHGTTVGAVSHVFLSHLHWDHVGGLAAVIGLRWMNTYAGVLQIYGPAGTRELVDGIIASLQPPARVGFGLGQRDAPPGSTVEVIEIGDGAEVALGQLSVRAVVNTHFDPDPDGRMGTQSLSYRFDWEERSITYTGDSGPSDALTALASDSDLLVSEIVALEPLVDSLLAQRPDMSAEAAANLRRHLATHHIAPEDVGAMADSARARRLVVTHYAMPGPLAASADYLTGAIRQSYAGPVELARDLSQFDVGCTG